jgi:hypothetical protein
MPLDLIAVNSLNAIMTLHPAVIVHGPADAKAALAVREPVTLLSAPGAAVFAGCLWWRELVAAARVEYPDVAATDILDCADASGIAMGALRSGVIRLVLWPTAPGWHAVAEIAKREGGYAVPQAPEALDMAVRGAARRLPDWLRQPTPDPTATR